MATNGSAADATAATVSVHIVSAINVGANTNGSADDVTVTVINAPIFSGLNGCVTYVISTYVSATNGSAVAVNTNYVQLIHHCWWH
jgi:hypothetical protein